MSEKPPDFHPPIKSPVIETYEKAPKPDGFENLSTQTCINIMGAAGINYSDHKDFQCLLDLSVNELKRLRDSKDCFGIGSGYYYTTLDHGKSVRSALTRRITLIQEAARHSGGNIPGPEDVNQLVTEIYESQTSQKRIHPDIDMTFQADLPQVPPKERDSAIEWITGRFAGPDMDVAKLFIGTPTFDSIFLKQQQTQFVRVVTKDGKTKMMRWQDVPKQIQKKIKWDDIPSIEVTPEKFLEQLEGFGYTIMPEGQQFRNERKRRGGARKTHWHPQHVIAPQITNKK